MSVYQELGTKLRNFMLDKTEEVDDKVEAIDKHERYVNTDLDYCCLTITTSEVIDIVANTVIPFNTFRAGNMEYDINNHSIKLKAGKTYKISLDYTITDGFATTHIYNLTTKERIHTLVKVGVNTESGISGCSGAIIYSPIVDCEIQALCTYVNYSPTIGINNPFSYFIVEEINRQIVIDPVEHVNDSQGIEDTPVGHIIAHMGTVAPKHYLICDGTEYNIEDYPYLAQHIEDNFGSISYFGGDGETTFRVPDLRGEFLRGTGTATRNTGSGAAVGQHQHPTQLARIQNYENKTIAMNVGPSGWSSNYCDSSVTVHNSIRYYKDVGIQNTSGGSSSVITARPTNTSVLYCIKYEPTYFMNTYNTNYMQPSLYSEEEKIVGCWVNGKPVYEKTLVDLYTGNSSAGIELKNIPDILFDVDKVISLSCRTTGNSDGYQESDMYLTARYVRAINGISICGEVGLYNGITSTDVIVRYTKTTDEENSFTNDMLKDSYVELTYSDEEISTMVSDILGGEE